VGGYGVGYTHCCGRWVLLLAAEDRIGYTPESKNPKSKTKTSINPQFKTLKLPTPNTQLSIIQKTHTLTSNHYKLHTQNTARQSKLNKHKHCNTSNINQQHPTTNQIKTNTHQHLTHSTNPSTQTNTSNNNKRHTYNNPKRQNSKHPTNIQNSHHKKCQSITNTKTTRTINKPKDPNKHTQTSTQTKHPTIQKSKNPKSDFPNSTIPKIKNNKIPRKGEGGRCGGMGWGTTTVRDPRHTRTTREEKKQ